MPMPIETIVADAPCGACGMATTRRTATLPDGNYPSVKGFSTLLGAGAAISFRVFTCPHAYPGTEPAVAKAAEVMASTQKQWGLVPVEYAAASLEAVDWEHSDWASHRLVVEIYFATLAERVAAGEGLYLHGRRGTGKTMLGAMVLNEAAKVGASGRFERVGAMLESLTKLDREAWREYRSSISRTPILVLDELGIEGATAKSLELLTTVIDERYAAKRVTITTTNLTTAELTERYKAHGKDGMGRLLDRLGQRNEILAFTGDSYRQRKRSDWLEREKAKAAELAANNYGADSIPDLMNTEWWGLNP